MYVFNLSRDAIDSIRQAAKIAIDQGKSLRFAYDDQTIKFKLGEGVWSPPLPIISETDVPR
jgi:hypothetical protein